VQDIKDVRHLIRSAKLGRDELGRLTEESCEACHWDSFLSCHDIYLCLSLRV
jgi:hypothetical protein